MFNIADLFEHENNFYLSCHSSRLGKLLAHYELYKQVIERSGCVVECGIFKGVSICRFAMFRELFSTNHAQKIIGFDTFDSFPETSFNQDIDPRQNFINAAGDKSISTQELYEVLEHKKVNHNIELIAGDIVETVPKYVSEHPELKISLLNLDTDIYEPAVVILEYLYPRIVSGGILILDDYGVFPGETKAVDDYFIGQSIQINKFPFAATPSFIIKP